MSNIKQPSAVPGELSLTQVAWLSAAVLVVSLGYGALLPLLPGWLASASPGGSTQEVARHTGYAIGEIYRVPAMALHAASMLAANVSPLVAKALLETP